MWRADSSRVSRAGSTHLRREPRRPVRISETKWVLARTPEATAGALQSHTQAVRAYARLHECLSEVLAVDWDRDVSLSGKRHRLFGGRRPKDADGPDRRCIAGRAAEVPASALMEEPANEEHLRKKEERNAKLGPSAVNARTQNSTSSARESRASRLQKPMWEHVVADGEMTPPKN
jgi:hypothetical protein